MRSFTLLLARFFGILGKVEKAHYDTQIHHDITKSQLDCITLWDLLR